jgi:hypothetical protein
MAHMKLGACLASLPGIGKEDQGKLPIGQLTDLSGPLQRRDAIHDDVLALSVHNDAKLAKKYRPAKDRLHPDAVIFPRIVRAAPLFPFPAVRAQFRDTFFRDFSLAGLLGLIISTLPFAPLHFL